MKKLIIYIFVIILLSSIGVSYFLFFNTKDGLSSKVVNFNEVKNKPKRDKSKDKRSGPEMEKKYWERLHYPYDAVLKPELLNSILSGVKNSTDEKYVSSSVTNWMPIGPYGSVIPSTSTRFTGRILDIYTKDTSNILVAAASGGLWSAGNPPVALTEMLTSQAVGSFDIQPGNSNVIVIGTGEPFMRAGTGMYISTNGGSNWSGINLNDTTPAGFYKIRYSSQNVIHAASTRGYYRSDNNGLSWQKYLNGDISDVAIHPASNNIIYCCRRMHADSDSGGVYKSTNNGLGWIRMTMGIPATDVGRTSISIAKSNPSIVFVLMAKRNGDMMGIYRTAGADTWTNVSPPADILEGIGWYTCEIAVSPTSPSKVFAGGVWLWGTTNLGLSWNKYDNNYDLNVHADQHAISWDSTGNSVWIGNDGGITFTDDDAFSFKTRKNNFPITQ
ncbi:MAG TPA: hypothetical protein PKE39_16365, partial [Ignavibacteria bacterium]|nr:hypothetical protein [Ignavibacteria bacterium]